MNLRSLLVPTVALGAVVALAACSGGTTPSASEGDADLKVAIVLGGLANDGGFNQIGADAVNSIADEGRAEVSIKESVHDSTDAEAAFRQYASQGYDLVIGWGLGFSESVFKVGEELPETDFVATGGADILEKATDNVATWTYASDQQGYLTGWIAGKSGLSPIAVVDGQLAPFNEASYAAVELGLAEANPDAVQLEPIFTGSWEDPTLANQAAQAQIAAGAKLILTAAEGFTSGVLSAAKDAGVATLGASNTSSSDAADVNLGLVTIDWAPVLSEIVATLEDDSFGGQSYTSTIENKGLVLRDFNQVDAAPDFPADIEEQINALAEQIASGDVVISAAN